MEFFRRLRVMVGGCLVDDIDYYNRVHAQVDMLTSEQSRNNTSNEGFGYRWDSDAVYGAFTTAALPGVDGGESINACFRPWSGLFTQTKFIP